MATEDSLMTLSGQVYRLDSQSEDYDPGLKIVRYKNLQESNTKSSK